MFSDVFRYELILVLPSMSAFYMMYKKEQGMVDRKCLTHKCYWLVMTSSFCGKKIRLACCLADSVLAHPQFKWSLNCFIIGMLL